MDFCTTNLQQIETSVVTSLSLSSIYFSGETKNIVVTCQQWCCWTSKALDINLYLSTYNEAGTLSRVSRRRWSSSRERRRWSTIQLRWLSPALTSLDETWRSIDHVTTSTSWLLVGYDPPFHTHTANPIPFGRNWTQTTFLPPSAVRMIMYSVVSVCHCVISFCERDIPEN